MFRLRSFTSLVFLLVFLTVSGVALACQVPVFRFALERWVADSYQVIITPGASGKFSEEEQAAIDFLKAAQSDGLNPDAPGVFANIAVEIKETPAADSPVAILSVTYPEKIRGFELKPIWTGTLTLDTAKRLIDSPLRRQLVKQLLAGESAVWVLVESGDAAADDAAATAIEESVIRAKETLKIPDGVMTRQEADSATNFAAVNADDILRSEVPLKIDFTLLRVSRDDPAEVMLLPMILNIEDDLGDYAGEPMVFPVFGRGRVLEPLIGRGVNGDNALEYATYICGACSCEVKDQNPGLDLLIAADWDTALHGSEVVIEKILPPLEGAGILAQAAAATDASLVPEDTTETSESEVSSSTSPAAGIAIAPMIFVAAALFIIIGAGTFLLIRRKSS
ncbi:MAG: hypothetical protein KDN20_04290 [Verrucomicrobiae bacterium]|nr:hypothetical protein [Verrucomicrobiae bacterium]